MRVDARPEVYVSIDVETDGPIPGDYSMLQLGAAAFEAGSETEIDVFSRNLARLPGASQHPDTMAWWAKQGDLYQRMTKETTGPLIAMQDFAIWAKKLPGKPVLVAYPAGFDQLHVYWYLMHFKVQHPFSFSCIDIKSYAMALLGEDYRTCTKRGFPKHWFPSDYSHTHDALDDAIGQGKLFIRMLQESRRK